jgi:adenosylhomocysteine nucleosidase
MKLGVLCGIEREAAIVRAAAGDTAHQVLCSGVIAEQAERAARGLVDGGATHLLSFGLAGALDDTLKPGDLLLPEQVVDASDNIWATDTAWRGRLKSPATEAHEITLLGIDDPAHTVAQKLFLRGIFDAAAVDMESHFLARVAAEAGLPFLVIRAIADDSRTSLPTAAMNAIGPNGREQPLSILKSLLRRPGEIPALLRLGRASRKGFDSLRRVAGLGFGL